MEADVLNFIVNVLKNFGYKVEIDKKYKGESGLEHRFHILAKRETKALLINIASEKDLKTAYLNTICACVDLKVDGVKFMIIAHTEKDINLLIDDSKVSFITFKDLGELNSKLFQVLSNI